MRKETFNDLCFLLQLALELKSFLLKSREPLSQLKNKLLLLYIKWQVVQNIVLWKTFGIHKSAVKKCLFRVVKAINDLIMKDYLRIQTLHKLLCIFYHKLNKTITSFRSHCDCLHVYIEKTNQKILLKYE
ncbi:hypothetical protein ACFW04_009351 [Cataglyphis niger]